ncbi:unnamed protein product [Protopolystoma xenopodis]|uniref:Uncharacterized protein n=1 Tax=Protopolystoma xenopodis TaxID=117903 RepID=A0A448WZY5_9PLAT|nr:unnamed protein product [Protopolystoma xenopodis]
MIRTSGTSHRLNTRLIGRQQKKELHMGMRKITEAVNIPGEKNLMNRRLEEGRVSDKFAYCLSKLEENKNGARPVDRRRLDQGSIAKRRKRDRVKGTGGKGFSAIKRCR